MAQQPITDPHEVLIIYNNIAKRKGYAIIPEGTELIDAKALGLGKRAAKAATLRKATDMLEWINKAPVYVPLPVPIANDNRTAPVKRQSFWRWLIG